MAVVTYTCRPKEKGKAQEIWDDAVDIFGIECVEELWDFGAGEWWLLIWNRQPLSKLVEFARKRNVPLDKMEVCGCEEDQERFIELKWKE